MQDSLRWPGSSHSGRTTRRTCEGFRVADASAQQIEQGRSHHGDPGDCDRRREAQNLGRELEQRRAHGADHDPSSHVARCPPSHVPRPCPQAGQAGKPCHPRGPPDTDGRHCPSPVTGLTSCAQHAGRRGACQSPGRHRCHQLPDTVQADARPPERRGLYQDRAPTGSPDTGDPAAHRSGVIGRGPAAAPSGSLALPGSAGGARHDGG